MVLSKSQVEKISDTIQLALTDAWPLLFTQEWLETDLIDEMLSVYEEYLEESVGPHLEETFRYKLANQCLNALVKRYVEELLGRKHSLGDDHIKKIEEDHKQFKKFFLRYTTRKKNVTSVLQALTDLWDILDADPDEIWLAFDSLVGNHPGFFLYSNPRRHPANA